MKTISKHQVFKNFLGTALLGLFLCVNAYAANGIVAIVGRQVITEQELDQRIRQIQAQRADQNLPAVSARDMLQALVTERALLQAAVDMGIEVGRQELDQAQQQVAAQNGLTVEQLIQLINKDGLSDSGYRQQLRDQLLVQKAQERVLEQRLKVTQADIQAVLREVDKPQGPQRIELAQVLIAVPEDATKEERAWRESWAASVVKRAQQGEDFSNLVQTFSSDHASANGSLGFKPSTAYPKLFLEATKALPIGGISSVVSSGAGFHVLKVLQREALPFALSVAQTRARHILRRAETRDQRKVAAQQLAGLRADILAGRIDFEAAAKKWGQDGTAPNGGDLDWASPGQFVPAFEAAMDALEPGVLSQPVETSFGVHLIQVLGRRQVEMSGAQKRAWAQTKLRKEKEASILDAWTREVRAGAYVQIQDPELR